jgi:hypothetical protein
MAVAVGEAQVTVTKKTLLSNSSLSLYVGTVTGGTEYPTGGATIGTNPESRYSLPEKLDSFDVKPTGLTAQLVSGNKLKLFAETTVGTSTETALSELKSKATMATALAAAPFTAIGLT